MTVSRPSDRVGLECCISPSPHCKIFPHRRCRRRNENQSLVCSLVAYSRTGKIVVHIPVTIYTSPRLHMLEPCVAPLHRGCLVVAWLEFGSSRSDIVNKVPSPRTKVGRRRLYVTAVHTRKLHRVDCGVGRICYGSFESCFCLRARYNAYSAHATE